jgi:DNA-binding HxlR family transcriptional regulator/putative sterol carrier protein
MTTRRTFDDACAVAHSLELVGERWALLVVRELLYGPKRFTDLRRGIPKASASVLTQRLRELEAAGIARKRKLGPPSGAQVYELTAWGRELRPALVAIARWGAASPFLPHDAGISADSVMLALETLFDATGSAGVEADLVVRFGDDAFGIRLAGGTIRIERGEPHEPDAGIGSDPVTLSSVIWGDLSLAAAVRDGELRVSGDRALVERFIGLFPLPDQAPVPLHAAG